MQLRPRFVDVRSFRRPTTVRAARLRTRRPFALLRAALLFTVACGLSAALGPAHAQFSRITAGMSYGVGGLFSEDYVYGVKQTATVGDFSSGLYAFDVGYVTRSRFTIGVRAHMMRVPLGGGGRIGRFDIVPGVVFLGYRKPAIVRSVSGFVGLGAGIASVRFVAEDGIEQDWDSMDEGRIGVSDDHPFVFEIFAGADVGLSEDFSLELTAASTFLDSEISYEPVPDAGFVSEHGQRVDARHIAIGLGLRWWVELW